MLDSISPTTSSLPPLLPLFIPLSFGYYIVFASITINGSTRPLRRLAWPLPFAVYSYKMELLSIFSPASQSLRRSHTGLDHTHTLQHPQLGLARNLIHPHHRRPSPLDLLLSQLHPLLVHSPVTQNVLRRGTHSGARNVRR